MKNILFIKQISLIKRVKFCLTIKKYILYVKVSEAEQKLNEILKMKTLPKTLYLFKNLYYNNIVYNYMENKRTL